MEPLKDRLIRQTEEVINDCRKRRGPLELELQSIAAQEDEAREMLQVLKNGQLPVVVEKRPRTLLREEDVWTAILEIDECFAARDLAELLDCTNGAALGWCKKFVKMNRLRVHRQGGVGGEPTIFERR